MSNFLRATWWALILGAVGIFVGMKRYYKTDTGRHQMDLCTQSVLLGGHARVGLEDSLFIGKGELAASNAQQVARIRQIVEALGREVATPAEAREMLGLKGGDRVAF